MNLSLVLASTVYIPLCVLRDMTQIPEECIQYTQIIATTIHLHAKCPLIGSFGKSEHLTL